MAFDVTQSVAELQASFTQWLAGIFGDENKALAFAQDPYGEFEDAGFTNQNLANLNVQQAVAQACESPGVPPYVKENLSGYSGPGYAGPPTIEHVVQQVQEVTNIVYQNNTEITNEIQNNSTNINVGDNFNGDIDVDNVNNSGDENAINTGDNFSGQQNSGDNAVQNTGNIEGGVVAGNNEGINTGANSNVENAVTGSGNTVGAQIQDVGGNVEDLQFATGVGGNVAQANDSHFDNSALAGGDAFNQGGNTLGDGSALSGTGAASGNFDNSTEDNDITTSTTTNTTTNTDSFNNDTETNTNTVTDSDNVNTEQGDGDQNDGDDTANDAFATV